MIKIMVNKETKRAKDPDLKPIHPGEILKSEFLKPLKLTEEKLAKEIQVAPQIIHDLVNEKNSLTVDLAYRFYFYFGVSAEYWLNFQKNYDLNTYQYLAESKIKKQIEPYSNHKKTMVI